MLSTFKKSPEQIDALNRVEAWTRTRFGLAPYEAILVSEFACALPGCPPLETVVAFWTADETRHHFKIFKRDYEVAPDDLRYARIKPALAVPEGFDPSCCRTNYDFNLTFTDASPSCQNQQSTPSPAPRAII